ncbi:D-inositol 3-phosphate glycosyltransferase [Synechococcus sp. MIT S9508]|nr:D-inositol 3-phosphate glycosyltransferase [Synechococcus sp. MIT S9508]
MILLLSFDVRRRGGIERLTLQVQNSLESTGHKVQLLTPKRLGPGCLGRQLGRMWFLLQLLPALWRSKQVLSMHVLMLKPLHWLKWCRRRDQDLLCWVHGIEVWGRNRTAQSRALSRCRKLLASSRFTREQLACIPCPISVVHPMADLIDPATPPAPLPATLTLLTVARMSLAESYKGHRLIVEALDELNRQSELKNGLVWEVIGEGDERPKLMQRVADLGLEPWVQFHGPLSDKALQAAFARSSIFLMPSFFSINERGEASGEGFGIVYLEAALAGRASIACEVGGQSDLIRHGETGWLIPPESAALVQVLRELIHTPNLAVKRGRQARAHALEHFSAQRFNCQLQEALRI